MVKMHVPLATHFIANKKLYNIITHFLKLEKYSNKKKLQERYMPTRQINDIWLSIKNETSSSEVA